MNRRFKPFDKNQPGPQDAIPTDGFNEGQRKVKERFGEALSKFLTENVEKHRQRAKEDGVGAVEFAFIMGGSIVGTGVKIMTELCGANESEGLEATRIFSAFLKKCQTAAFERARKANKDDNKNGTSN